MRKLIVATILICLLVCGVNAWTIDDSQHRYNGSVDFYSDGSGTLNVTGHPIIKFSWYQSGDVIRANCLFYGVNVQYNSSSDELYSSDVADVVLRR